MLVNPWIYDFAAYDFWAKPLGLLYLASILRKNGYEINYLDCLSPPRPQATHHDSRLPLHRKPDGRGKLPKQEIEKPPQLASVPRRYCRYGISVEAFLSEMSAVTPPAAILITSPMTYWYPGAFEAIRLTKGLFPKTPIVFGGAYTTLCYGHAKAKSGADVVFSGGSLREALLLISSLTGKEPISSPDPENLDSLPYPAFDLIDPNFYVCVTTSRGCPYRCHYCASHLLSPRFLRRNFSAVADEIQFWNSCHSVSNIAFYDDALLFQPENHFIPLLREILRRQIRCDFHVPNGMHVRAITPEIARLMFEAGFRSIRLGLDTADESRMESMAGKTTREEFSRAVDALRDAGFSEEEIGVYLLVGLPRQTAQEVETSIRFVKSLGARPYLAEYSPIPGTPLWEEAVRVSPFDLAREPLFHNNSLLPCQWQGLTPDDLNRLKMTLRS